MPPKNKMPAAASSNRDSHNMELEDHMLFICPECGKEYKAQQDWRKHLNVQHSYTSKTVEDFDFKEINDKYHECQICLKWVANAHQAIALLQYHRFMHLPYSRTYRCRHCPGSFSRKRALCEHLYRFHSRTIARMEKERKINAAKQTMREKDPKHNKEFYMKYCCPLCGKIFHHFHAWQQHINAAHSSTSSDLRMHRIQSTSNFYCAQCCYTLKNNPKKSQLQRHRYTHLPYSQYFLCSYCTARKCYKADVLLHVLKCHKTEFEKHKEYITIPVEWGGSPNGEVLKELESLLAANTQPKQTDILQKAIQDSFINLEEEQVEKEVLTKFSHESALDQSLKELDDILTSEIDPHLQLKTTNAPISYEIDENELEELCKEMFVEIVEPPIKVQQDYADKPNRKRLKLDLAANEIPIKINDSLQREMQKYINYLCPECGSEFETQSLWRTHVFEQHNLANAVETKFRAFNSQKSSYLCLVCYQVQRTAKHSELRRHHFQHMPYQAYLKCSICTKTKSSKPKMLQHLQFAHLLQIQKGSFALSSSPAKTMAKNYKCIDCEKMYAMQTRFETHVRQCPKRLQPLATGQYDIVKNMKLLEHLQKASIRIGNLLLEEGVDVSSMKLPFK